MLLRSRRAGNFASLNRPLSAIVLALLGCATTSAQPQELRFQFDPSATKITFTLGDILHTVRGSFKLKKGDVEDNVGTKSIVGTVTVDATSGESGNRSRDRKMHKEILESARYPEIIFRPDRVDGTVAPIGTSTVQVHGIFSIHGSDHELTMPVRVEVFPDHWIADTHFSIPYVKWGIKNPSTFVLRVSESVEIDVHATGANPVASSAR
jgi:polyisoprenoid-binding protein YceI